MKDKENTEPRLPITHELKCWPEPFAAVVNGTKTFEWRKDDRPPPDDFRVGDTLWLREWIPDGTVMLGYPVVGHHTGQHVYRRVTYIIREGFGIPPGYCIMGLAAASTKDNENTNPLVSERKPLSYYIDNAIFHVDSDAPLPQFTDRTMLESWMAMAKEVEAARSKDKESIEALQASLLDVAEKSTARIAALEELLGAVDAAEVEGFTEHLQNGRADLALDIYNRRIAYARALLNQQPPTT